MSWDAGWTESSAGLSALGIREQRDAVEQGRAPEGFSVVWGFLGGLVILQQLQSWML